jgi:hypothetical protein
VDVYGQESAAGLVEAVSKNANLMLIRLIAKKKSDW